MLKVDNLAEFEAGINNWLKEVDDLAVGAFRGLSVKLFEAVLRNSPQFSGNAVANWRYSVNGVDTSSDDLFKQLWNEHGTTYSKTDRNEGAEEYAIAISSGRDLQVKSLTNIIYISNSVDYADWLSTATEKDLRDVNHVGHLISHSILDVVEGHLFINTAKAETLKQARIA